MMAYVAVHIMGVQNKLMDEIDQIVVPTLICVGTGDKFCSIEGTQQLIAKLMSAV